MLTMKTISKKIPGLLPPMPKDQKVEKLDQKLKVELVELLGRQDKMLSNKSFINKLPDKGAKIALFKEKLLKELAHRDEVEKSGNLLSNLLSHMNIDKNKSTVESIEWGGKEVELKCLDSDDDSDPEDPLAILAQSTDLKKKVIILKKEETLIKSEDLKEIASFKLSESKPTSSSTNGMDEHVKYIFANTIDKVLPNQRVSFKPYKTTVSNVHDPSKEMLRKRGKFWEVTAATPPPAIHGAVQEIPLQESLRLQNVQNQHLKEIQIKHAAERLAAQLGKTLGDSRLSSVAGGHYREMAEIYSEDSDSSTDDETSDKEVHDEEPHEGGVVFTVMK